MEETDGDASAAEPVDGAPAPADGTGASSRPSRRWFVAGGLALVAGGGAGVTVGLARDTAHPAARDRVPRALEQHLLAAVADERDLVRLARTAQGNAADRTVSAALLRDHEAHLGALLAAVHETAPTAASATSSGPSSAPGARTGHDRAGLRRVERRAARRAAHRASLLAGHPQTATVAVLLASIAACESTHVELLG